MPAIQPERGRAVCKIHGDVQCGVEVLLDENGDSSDESIPLEGSSTGLWCKWLRYHAWISRVKRRTGH